MQSSSRHCSARNPISARCWKALPKARLFCGSWRALIPHGCCACCSPIPTSTSPRCLAEHGRDAGVEHRCRLRRCALLRRMKAEAALLIALADIGGVWPVMRAARALTELADAAVDAAVRFILAEAARDGRLKPADKPDRRRAAATSCWRWARWGHSNSTIRAISISSFFTNPRPRPCRRTPSHQRFTCG